MPDEKEINNEEVVESTETASESNPETPKVQTPEELAAEYLGGWKRALADYKNLQKETTDKSKEWMEIGVSRVIERLGPIFNNLTQAIEHIPAEQKSQPWAVGISYIKNNFLDLLKEFGLTLIATVGEKFDPNQHEAVGEDESEGESGIIVREASAGFKKGERVIIPAKVIVRK